MHIILNGSEKLFVWTISLAGRHFSSCASCENKKHQKKTKSHFDLIILLLLNRQRFTVEKGKSAFLMSRMILKGTSVMHLKLCPGLNKLDTMERERALITKLHLERLLAQKKRVLSQRKQGKQLWWYILVKDRSPVIRI